MSDTGLPTRHISVMALAVVISVGGADALKAQTAAVWGELQAGPFPVGYRVLYELDPSRVWIPASSADRLEEFARPVRISVWYPAEPALPATGMTLAEYVRDTVTDEYFASLNRLLERRFEGLFTAVSHELYDSLLMLPLATHANPPPMAGPFPLVMYSSGGQASLPDNGVLAAFLASHGFVVGAVPQLEGSAVHPTRGGYGARVEVQTRDVEFAMGRLQDFPGVDRRRLGVIGYSLGGLVALRMAARNSNVDAIVGLDPSYAYQEDLDDVNGSLSLNIADLRLPILSLQAGSAAARSRHSTFVHDTLHFADRYVGHVAETVHGDFSEIKSMLIPALVSSEGLEPALVQAHRGYMAMCRYVLRFLEGVLKNDPAGLEFAARSSADNAMDADLVQMELRRGIGVPDETGFIELLETQGYDEAEQRLQDAMREHPHIVVMREDVMNDIGYRLRDDGQLDLAINAFRLNTEAHPLSARAQNALAEAHLTRGDSLLVIRAYERLLQILPLDTSLGNAGREEMRRDAELKLRLLRLTRPRGSETAGLVNSMPGRSRR